MQREYIEWHDVADLLLPDADTTVLIYLPDDDEAVWLGWYEDGEGWFEVGGGAIEGVLRWAHLPRGDQQAPT